MIDLHTHSTFSDGTLTPEELVREAVRAGVSAIALTDHDTMAGLPRFLQAAESAGVRAIPGVEISVEFPRGTFHMLGYFVDHSNEALNEALLWIREGRHIRNQKMLEKLRSLGMNISWEEVQSYAGDEVVGRPHFAQALLAHGYVSSKEEAFERYLGKGKPAYVDRRRFPPAESIRLIQEGGGIAVLAHPSTLGLSGVELEKFVGELAREGLVGIEAYYSEHTLEQTQTYIALARTFGLAVTGGSDFHGGLMPEIRLGMGFGNLSVPDDVLEELERKRCLRK